MTTIGGSNIYNIAIKGSFDDCQKIVKQMFADNIFRQTINMSGVNSINWARIIFQIVYYFYSFLRLNKKKLIFQFQQEILVMPTQDIWQKKWAYQ